MAVNPLDDGVADHYRDWSYPEPIQDLPGWLLNHWQWFDPSHAQMLFWPDRGQRSSLDILVAGCGANQAAVIAYTNPFARVVAIDVSEPSLDHHRLLKERYQLKNLECFHLPIEEVVALNRDFDLIISTGVLHHLADPELGLRRLADCLRPEGVIALMLYARQGRLGVEMMQAVFRDLGLQQDAAALFTVKEAIALLPAEHPLHSYLAVAPDLRFDAGLVDTFLHGRDRSYTVEDCLALVSAAGLVFQDWFLKTAYHPPSPPRGGFYRAVAALPLRQRWSTMERINTGNACHFFMACRPERPISSYRIAMESEAVFDLVPHFRYRCRFEGRAIDGPGGRMDLSGDQQQLVSLIDGRRSIREILGRDAGAVDAPGVALFRSLWQRDVLAMGLSV
ncbi:MAG: class I SAM-dependent methyltransferase [Cyanobacteriota bacterium]